MKVTWRVRLAHHALKLLPFVVLFMFTPSALEMSPSFLTRFLNLTAVVLLVGNIILNNGHNRMIWNYGCPLCKGPSEESRTKPYFRWKVRLALRSRAILLACAIGALIVFGLVNRGKDDTEYPFWVYLIVTFGSVAVLMIFLRSLRFLATYKINEEEIPFTNLGSAATQRLAHRSVKIAPYVMVIPFVISLLPNGVMTKIAFVVSCAVIVPFIWLEEKHEDNLCEACFSEFPIDAPERAQKRQQRFFLFHRYYRLLPISLVAALASAFLLGGMAGKITTVAIVFVIAVPITMLFTFHSKFNLWCPICHPRRDDDDDEYPVVPDSPDGREIPVPA